MDGLLAVSGSRGSSFTYYNTLSGAGGLYCSRGQQVVLANGGNTFTGEVRINTNRTEGEGELRLFADGASVLVLCSDTQQYICKYMRPNATIAYKLACEYIGAVFAEAWRIDTPPFALVQIMSAHWTSVRQ